MNELLRALEVVQYLKSCGIKAIIAGGAVRDILHGKPPKDYDVVVLGYERIEYVEAVLERGDFKYDPFGEGSSYLNEAGNSPNIDWVIKVDHYGTVIDIIQQATIPHGAHEVVENFDCTLNMAWIDSDTLEVCKHPRYPALGALVEMLPKCDFPEARTLYLGQKYPEYQWPIQPKRPEYPVAPSIPLGAPCAAS